MARPLIGHRSSACKELVQRLRPKLAPLFGTAGLPLFESCPATALMEAGVRNLVRERALVLTCGAFSERWHEIALGAGKRADALPVDWGRANRAGELRRALATGAYDAVTITHNETSTGVMNPLPELTAAAREFDVLVLVDAVSSLAGAPVDFDRNGIDFCFAGVQKCLALPPGLSVYALSERALRRAAEIPGRGWLLDFVRAVRGLDKGETPATPSIPHLFALEAQLDAIAAEGLPARFARHAAMAERTRAWAAARGLSMYSEAPHHSPTVSAIAAGGRDVEALVRRARAAGFVLSNGYGKLKGLTFRIGHMGDHRIEALERLLASLE
jgi:predicted phosphoserine aminotransferase